MRAIQCSKVLALVVVTLVGVEGVWGQTPVANIETSRRYDSPGTYNFIVPAGMTSITLEAWGGGGGGGYATSNGRATGGGGGGAYAKSIIAVSPGDVLIITVGAGGSGASGSNDGGNSSVSRSNIDLVRAAGGTGVPNNETSGGTGGLRGACEYNVLAYDGGNGGAGGDGGSRGAGGGGGGAGSSGKGQKGNNGGSSNAGGSGGSPVTEYGGRGGKGADEGSYYIWPGSPNYRGKGGDASEYGGGGGGGKRAATSGIDTDGGSGASGLVRISSNFPSPPVIDLASISQVCEGDVALTATAPYSVRAANGWEWIRDGVAPGTYTSTNTFAAPLSGKYTVRAHYGDVRWIVDGTYSSVYDTSSSTSSATITVIPIPTISNKTITVCSGEHFEVSPVNTGSDVVPNETKYTWQDPITGTTEDSNLIYGTITNTTANAITVTYVVTPIAGDCVGATFNLVVTVNPKPVLPLNELTICSGQSVTSYSPVAGTTGIIPTGTTYSWLLSNVSPTGAISNAPLGGGPAATITLGTLENETDARATVSYAVTPQTQQGCVGAPFYFNILVHPIPEEIVVPSEICSGDAFQLKLKYPNNRVYDNVNNGTYTSSASSIAYIDANGKLWTDVNVSNGVPQKRPAYDENEGLGGNVTITYTTADGCVVTRDIYVKPRTKTPEIRWDFDGTCRIDEDVEHPGGDSAHVATPWNVNDIDRVYFVNHLVWDSLVVVNHVEDPSPVENVKHLERITWYEDNNGNPGKEIRKGLASLPGDGRLANFWQNKSHAPETYWATVTNPDECESYPVRVTVNIEEELPIILKDLIGYVQPAGTSKIDLEKHLDLNLDPSQELLWYETEADATAKDGEGEYLEGIGKPDSLDITVPIDTTYYLVKADTFGCRSAVTPFRIRLVPMPQISLTPDMLVCPNEPVTVTLTIANGIPPYSFTIANMNTQAEDKQENYLSDTYTFTVNPQVTVNRRVIEFKDSLTTYIFEDIDEQYGLHTPATGYFAQNTLSVVVTEITDITPNSGPIGGGTYTGDPDDPTDIAGLVTITGSGFDPFGLHSVPRVTFGGIDATNVRVVSNDTIECTPPSQQLSGNVTVAVIADCGTVTLTNGYRYEPMNIIGVTPNYGPVTGGTHVVIRGTGLLAADVDPNSVTVTIAGVPATILSGNTNRKIECVTGVSTRSMIGDIVVHNGAETRTFAKSFTYYPVRFVDDGKWSDSHHWETQTNDHILPFPGASVQIEANCLQDTLVNMDSITVAPSKAYTLAAGVVMEAKVFTLKENATFLDNNVTNAGNMRALLQNVEHRLESGRNWYVSSPVRGVQGGSPVGDALGKDAQGNDLEVVGGEWRVEYFEKLTRAWTKEEKATAFLAGLGYTAYSKDVDIAVKFSGKYNDGDLSTPFNVTRRNDESPIDGFNLVGNPYPSYWRWTAETATQAKLHSTIWYRTRVGGVYQFWSYNASGDVAVAPGWEDATPTGSHSLAYIPPMQAFWVRMIEGETSSILTFADSRRSHADHASNGMKAKPRTDSEAEPATDSARPLLRLTATAKASSDETLIYAHAAATPGFDTYDSDKWFLNRGMEIFTLPATSDRPLVINGLPALTAGTEIPLGFRANEAGTFCFHAKEILNIDSLDVFLMDKWRGIECDLRQGDYCFASNSIPTTDRFSIVFRTLDESNSLPDAETLDTDDGSNDRLLAYADREGRVVVMLHLENNRRESANVSVVDISGRVIAEQEVVAGVETVINGAFPDGMYVLRAGRCTAKVMVRR